MTAPGPKGLLADKRSNAHPVTLEAVQAVHYTIGDLKEINERVYKPLTEDQLKMLAALYLRSTVNGMLPWVTA